MAIASSAGKRGVAGGRLSAPFVLFIVALLLLMGACELPETAQDRTPALPQGFADLQAPNVPLLAVLYLDQGSPVALSTETFGLESPSSGDAAAAAVAVESLTVWVGPSKESLAIEAVMTTEEGAQALEKAASQEQGDGSGESPWFSREGRRLTLVQGEASWREATIAAFQNGERTAITEAHPEAWRSVQLLPERPPQEAVAVGVLLDGEGLRQDLEAAEDPMLRNLATVLRVVPTQGAIAIAGYTKEPIVLDGAAGVDYIQQANIRSVVVVRTSLLAGLVAPALGTLAGVLNLERVQDGDSEHFRYAREEGTAILVPDGSSVYIVFAPGGENEGESLLDYLDEKDPAPATDATAASS
jgi:hypothetical protein